MQGWPQAHGRKWRGPCFCLAILGLTAHTFCASCAILSAPAALADARGCTRDLSELAPAQVYDVAGWVQKHPGGKVLLTYVGEDATDSVKAFHRDEEQMRKYLSPLHIATLAEEKSVQVLLHLITRALGLHDV